MKIKWLYDIELEVVTDFNEETEETTTETAVFKKGEDCVVDIVGAVRTDQQNTVDLQFGDGSVAYAVDRFNFAELVRPKVYLASLLNTAAQEVNNIAITIGFQAANNSLGKMAERVVGLLGQGVIQRDDPLVEELVRLGYLDFEKKGDNEHADRFEPLPAEVTKGGDE